MVSHLLLLPWCMAITGYQINSNNSNSQQQPTASYWQTGKLLPGASSPARVKTTTKQYMRTNSNMLILCANCSMHEQRFNLWLYCWHSLLSVEKRSIMSHEFCHNPSEFYEYYLVYDIPIIWWSYMPPTIPNLCYCITLY